jgi:polyhydroxyalkanoate synthase subunit PhaC
MMRSRKRKKNFRSLDLPPYSGEAMAAPKRGPRKIAVLPAAEVGAAAKASAPLSASRDVSVGLRTSQKQDRDSYSVTALADITDRALHASIARFTAGISPAALIEAYFDWATHLTYAPGKRMQLMDKATRKAVRFANYAARCAIEGGKTERCIEPLPQDHRFSGESLAEMAL